MGNPFSLKGKTVVITGASSGIGRQCAIDCAGMGAKVALIARSEQRLQETLQTMVGEGHQMYAFDLTDLTHIADLTKRIVSYMGPIDGIVHSAGISNVLPLKLMTPEETATLFNTNVYAAIELTRQCCKMGHINKAGGSIIFISSIMGCVGENAKSLYSMTKGALIAGVRSLACEYGRRKIRFNCISPGAIETPINAERPYMKDPEKRAMLESQHILGIGKPEDISNACIYLLSDASRWVTGTNLIVDGGYIAK